MFEINSEKIDLQKSNTIKRKDISLDKDLDCFILMSGNNESFIEVALNNILDAIIDKVWISNTYKEFSIALENINSFIKTWQLDGNDEIEVDIIIGILANNTFMFSNVWEASCCLLKNDDELIELTTKQENKKDFSFISSWDLRNDEIILMSTKRVLDYLSSSDIVDWWDENKNIETFNSNIKSILLEEILEHNILFTSLKYISHIEQVEESQPIYSNIIEQYKTIKETKLGKKLGKQCSKISKKIKSSPKNIKNIVFMAWIIISLVLIYQVLSTLVSVSTNNNTKEIAKTELIEAKSYIRIASENIANQSNFELNIKNAEELIDQIREKKIFLNDIEKINDDINILKKQFNKIETFDQSIDNALFQGNLESAVKIIKNNKKPFIINEKWILWPILPNTTPKNYVFNSLENTEVFVDATPLWNDIMLLTNFSKVVRFTQNWHFSYTDVIGQKAWEKAKEIKSFWQNIYLVWKENSQIFKHSKNGTKFNAAKGYLKKDDLAQIWEILSIGIDGSFYILKKDLSIVKFYSSPKYRLETVVINKLPESYNQIEDRVTLKSRWDLNYLYMLLNNKIWILKPNSKDYRNTKSLTYIWQIEWSTSVIKDFFVNYDWEMYVLNQEWVYKVSFEISDDKVILR